jgi:integrase
MTNQFTRLIWSLRVSFGKGAKIKQSTKPQALYGFLSLNGTTAGPYTLGLKCLVAEWDQATQRATGEGETAARLNERIAAIKKEHQAIIDRLREENGVNPDAQTVRYVWCSKSQPLPMVHQACVLWYENCKAQNGTIEDRAVSTLKKYTRYNDILAEYIAHLGRAKDLPISVVTIRWVKDYVHWIQTRTAADGRAKMSRGSATRVGYQLKYAFDYMIELGHLKTNPLASLKLSRGPVKEVYYLEDRHLQKLAAFEFTGTLAIIQKVTLLLCYTGLDLVDARKLLADPQRYIVKAQLGGGAKIIIPRAKSSKEQQIPILPGVDAMIEELNAIHRSIPHEVIINKNLKLFESLIGFPHTLTVKVLRKTAGWYWLSEGYSIEFVSKLLGHSSVKMTETHYAKVTGKRIDREVAEIGLFRPPLSRPLETTRLQA